MNENFENNSEGQSSFRRSKTNRIYVDKNFEQLYKQHVEKFSIKKTPELNKLNNLLGDDIKLISHQFQDYNLPKDKKWLTFYFSTKIERVFLDYYTCFNSIELFTDHTGIYCKPKWLKVLEKRYHYFIDLHKKAKEDFDIEFLAFLEMGKIEMKKIGIKSW